tara:strand:+ start:781 stop:1695 length:915 start_codon:yes stop_codon:yes gene_type:complete
MAVLVRSSPGSLVLVKAAADRDEEHTEGRPVKSLWELVNDMWRGANVKKRKRTLTDKGHENVKGDAGTGYYRDELLALGHLHDALVDNDLSRVHDEGSHPDDRYFAGGLIDPETGHPMQPGEAATNHMLQLGQKAKSALRVRHRIAQSKSKHFHPETGEKLGFYDDGPWGAGTGDHFRVRLERETGNKYGARKPRIKGTSTTTRFLDPERGLVKVHTLTPHDEGMDPIVTHHYQDGTKEVVSGGGQTPSATPPESTGESTESPLDSSFSHLQNSDAEQASDAGRPEGLSDAEWAKIQQMRSGDA